MSSSLLILSANGMIILATIALVHYTITYWCSSLKGIPGPFLAKFTNWWRLYNHYRQRHIETQVALHNKYGDAVRMGPNLVSLSDPKLVKVIYNTRGSFRKSDFYAVNDALHDGKLLQNLFSTRSNSFHANAIKPIQKLYSFNSSLQLEILMDKNLRSFCLALETRFNSSQNESKTFDLSPWISYFGWDFMSEMTLSERMGFLDHGKDINGMIEKSEHVARYLSVVGQIPVLDNFLGKNAYLPYKFSDYSQTASFCAQQFVQRMQKLDVYNDNQDFMAGFLQARKEYPDLVSDNEIIGYLMLNIAAGADSTAIAAQAIVYHVLKHPRVQAKLVSELQSASLAFPPAYAGVRNLPYLDACIKEGLRIHPPAGLLLERVVPSTGLYLPSEKLTLPPGTIVGMNPWVLARDERVFGENTDRYIPERWLRKSEESAEDFENRLRAMAAVDLVFGSGNRACLGRPLAMIELHKLIATLFSRYEISLEDPSLEWTLKKQWMVWPSNIRVKLFMRDAVE